MNALLDIRAAPRLKEQVGPVSYDAEQAVLGVILRDNSVWPDVAYLKPHTFADETHGALWQAMGEAINANGLATPVLLFERFRRDPGFEEMGGIRYLADLIDQAPPNHTVSAYAAMVQGLAVRRDLMVFGSLVRSRAGESDEISATDLLGEVRTALDALEAESAADDVSMIAAPDAALAAVDHMEELARTGKIKGKMTGLRCVDRRLGGLRPGALVVVGGRPGMGKTALARAIASAAADRNPDDQFLFLGIEMAPEEMMQRELSARTHIDGEGVEYRAMGSGKATPMDLANIRRMQAKVPRNLILDDCHSLSIEDVRRKVWARRRKGPIGAVVIDYLQLMRRPTANGRNDAAVLGEMTQGLKLIARQAGICIVLLSQLSRQVEYRDDKRPQLSDLRESGSIEQDADAVLFPYREFYYVERAEPKARTNEHLEWEVKCADLRSRLDVICAKQRQGPVGMDRQVYHAEFDHIEDERD